MSLPTIEVGRSVWIRLLVALAILIIPASLYFFTYFNTKYDFAVQQRFRALNELEHQFNRGLSNFDNLFRFSKFKEFTQTERQEATKVVADFWAYLEEWENWGADQITTENQSRYRVLHREQEALQGELDEVGINLSKQGKQLNEKIGGLKNRLEDVEAELAELLEFSDVATQPDESEPDKLEPKEPKEPKEVKKWPKYIDKDILNWLGDWQDYKKCVHTGSPTKTSDKPCKKPKKTPKNIIKNLQRELDSISNYLQEIGTSAVYANTRYEVVKKEDCDSDSPGYRATRFKVITSREPFHLSVEDACINEFRTMTALQDDGGTKGVLQAQVPLRDLLQPDSALRYFDQILILNTEGLVVYRSGQEDRISVDNDSGLPLQANRNDFARFTHLSGLLAKTATDDSILEQNSNNSSPGTLAGSFSRVVEEPVGDMPHLFFLQPLRPSVGEQTETASAGKPWHVIGVVRKSQLLSDVSKVSLNAMAALLLILLLMLLSTPLLKLRFATVTEPISTAQVFLIGTSLILGTCIITLILLDLRTYAGLKDRMDATAKQISWRMRHEFKDELDKTIAENKKAFLITNTGHLRQQTSSNSDSLTADSIGVTCNRENASRTGIHPNKLKIKDSYPPFELAYLLDAEGHQVDSQRTYRQEFAESISVPKRQYFLHARDGPLWQQSTAAGTPNEAFFLERIFTYDHGFWLTALSMPVATNDSIDVPCAARVRVTLKVMQSFFATVLPPSFGFAVLEDASGEVIYHSDNSRSLLENFYVETDNNERLITAVHARRNEEVTGYYYGDGHRFYVAPVADTPWSLVVFYDKTLIRTLNFEILISTITVQLIYALFILVGLLVFRWLTQHKRWRFIWPRAAVLREYRYLASILLVSQGLAWLFVTHQDEKYNLLTILALPLFTLSLIAYLLDQKHQWRSTTVSYHMKRSVTSVFLLLGILGMSFSSLRPWSWSVHQIQIVLLLLAVLLLIFSSRAAQNYVPEKSFPGKERVVRFWYLTCAMLVLVLVSVWPTKLLFDDIFQLQADKLLRMSQHHVLQQVDQRRDAINHDLNRIDPDQHMSYTDNYRGIYPTTDIFDAPDSGLSETAIINSSTHYAEPDSGNKCDNPTTGTPGDRRKIYRDHPVSFLTENFPSYSPLSAWLHVMFFEHANDSNWCAKAEESKLTFTKASVTDSGTYQIESKKIPMENSDDLEIQASFYGGLILLFFMMLYALRIISQRVLGLDFPVIRTHWDLENIVDDIENWKGTRRIVLAPSSKFIHKLKRHLSDLGEVSEIDLSSSEGQQKLLDLAAQMNREEHDVALLRSPRFFNCAQETREQLLEALEKLDACPQTTLILCTDLFPWLNLALTDSQLAHNDFTDEEKIRWQELLGNFQSGHASLDAMDSLTSIEALLLYECRNSELEEIRQSIEAEPAFQRAVELQKNPWRNILKSFFAYFKNSESGNDILTGKELIDDVTQRAKHFHKTLWQCCNEEEQYILYRMAQGHMINSLHGNLLERLLRLGLIRKDPDFRISSYSLQKFILSAETPAEAKAWEKKTPPSIWSHLRVPLLLLLLTLFVFLAYVGPNVIESMLGLLPAILLALPLIMRFLSGSGKK